VVEQIAEQYPQRFAPMTMHVNADGFDTPWAQHRLDVFYGLAATVPTFMVDALWNCQSDDYQYYVEQQMAQPTDVTLELSANPAGGSDWDVTARVCLEGGSSRQMRVFIADTLDARPGLPRYATNVLKQDVFSSDVTVSGGGCQNVTTMITFDPESMANTSDIVIIAWAQQPATSAPTTVHQAGIMRWPFPAGSQLTTIELSPTDVTLGLGGQIDFTATGRDQFGEIFPLDNPTWSLGSGSGGGTFDPATGSATTTFTATMAGTRQILCSDGNVTGAALVTITEAARLESIEVDPASVTVNVEGEVVFTATGRDQYGADFPLGDPSWAVSGVGDGTFDSDGGSSTTFTATYPGACAVTCTQAGVTGTASVSITGDDPALSSITISPAGAQIRVGDEVELTANGSDQYGRTFELVDPAWRIEGSADGHFEPTDGSATTTFTATAHGSADIICSDAGIEGGTTLEISAPGLPAPRKVRGRVAP
jgi:plastocyanin